VTETTTEFREVTDDSDFGNFGTSTGAPKLETRPEVKKIGPAAKTESSSSSSGANPYKTFLFFTVGWE
jgi:hypothetical protein